MRVRQRGTIYLLASPGAARRRGCTRVCAASAFPAGTLRADVCVVGAGPAGLTVAHELTTSGLDVVVLEAGPASPPPGGQDVTTTRNVGLPYSPAATRSSGVGGSSLRWCVETPLGQGYVRLKELDPIDFEDRALLAVPGWPISRASLDVWYARARELLRLCPADDGRDTAVHGLVERRVYSFAHRSVFTETIPAALRSHPRVTLLAGCTVTEIRTDRGPGHVSALTCWSEEEGGLSVEAGAYVLAGGAIENARLLLASRSSEPAGIGNAEDQVGRHFMEHPHYVSGVAVPRSGATGTSPDAWDLTTRDGAVVQDHYALGPEALRRAGLLNAAYKLKPFTTRVEFLRFGYEGRHDQSVVDAYLEARFAVRKRALREVPGTSLIRLAGAAPALGRFALRRAGWDRAVGRLRPRAHHGLHVRVMGEQEPSPESRVRLGCEPDRLGVPLAELDWRLSSLDIDSMVRGQRTVAAGLGAAVGANVISTLGPEGAPQPGGGAHHMGTTRMSTRASAGVVDDQCRVHGLRNLYVAGSSVFPTGGAANPTLTIVALAARLAGHLARELGRARRAPAGDSGRG